jgi:hypothetical protein
MPKLAVAVATIALFVTGCGSGTKTVTLSAPATGWSARARINFVNYCESAAGPSHATVCECEASKIEAQVPSDTQLRELENDPADKAHLVKLMIDASYACVGKGE